MYALDDSRILQKISTGQRGVFSTSDLKVALAERHPAAFTRRVEVQLKAGVLRRFIRGWYVTESFDLPTLSQRIAPRSCVSFGTVLALALLIGPRPERQILATKVGPKRRYAGLGYTITHLSISEHLDFGWSIEEGVRIADPEKAALDTLYFHLRARRYVFDIYSDVRYQRLDRKRLSDYLGRYRNPRFIAFARKVLALA